MGICLTNSLTCGDCGGDPEPCVCPTVIVAEASGCCGGTDLPGWDVGSIDPPTMRIVGPLPSSTVLASGSGTLVDGRWRLTYDPGQPCEARTYRIEIERAPYFLDYETEVTIPANCATVEQVGASVGPTTLAEGYHCGPCDRPVPEELTISTPNGSGTLTRDPDTGKWVGIVAVTWGRRYGCERRIPPGSLPGAIGCNVIRDEGVGEVLIRFELTLGGCGTASLSATYWVIGTGSGPFAYGGQADCKGISDVCPTGTTDSAGNPLGWLLTPWHPDDDPPDLPCYIAGLGVTLGTRYINNLCAVPFGAEGDPSDPCDDWDWIEIGCCVLGPGTAGKLTQFLGLDLPDSTCSPLSLEFEMSEGNLYPDCVPWGGPVTVTP